MIHILHFNEANSALLNAARMCNIILIGVKMQQLLHVMFLEMRFMDDCDTTLYFFHTEEWSAIILTIVISKSIHYSTLQKSNSFKNGWSIQLK